MELKSNVININQQNQLIGEIHEITEDGWEGRLGWKIGDIDIDDFLEQNIGKKVIIQVI